MKKQVLSDNVKRNYLTCSALTVVEKETDNASIWRKLQQSFGNTCLLLQKKLEKLEKLGGFWKVKDDESIRDMLAKIVNTMRDLSSLVTKYKIEGQYYEGGGSTGFFTSWRPSPPEFSEQKFGVPE